MEHFSDAAGRHWSDAQVLEQDQRIDNADQLYGIAAECAIKSALMLSTAHLTTGELSKFYKTHIDELWDKVAAGALPRHLPGLPPLLKMDNPFSDWSVGQRYEQSGSVAQDTIDRHKTMAKRLLSAAGIVGQRSKR